MGLTIAHVIRCRALGIAQRALVTLLTTLEDRFRQLAKHELHRAHGVVIGWNHDVRERRVAVGVQDTDHRHVHALGFAHGVVFAPRVDHDQGTGKAVQITDAFEVAANALHLAAHRRLVLLLVLLDAAGGFQVLELNQASQALAHRRKVGQRAADPTLGDWWHAALLCLGFDHGTNLLLRAEEHDLRAGCSQVPQEVRRAIQPADCLLEVDHVDLVPFAVNERLHLGVPPTGLVAIVDACVDQFLDGYERHVVDGSLPDDGFACAAFCANRLLATGRNERSPAVMKGGGF